MTSRPMVVVSQRQLPKDDLEVGDVIEGLPNQVFPITMPNRVPVVSSARTRRYCGGLNSSRLRLAINGAYSYPDTFYADGVVCATEGWLRAVACNVNRSMEGAGHSCPFLFCKRRDHAE